jgi:hypothetical protein
VIVIREGQDPVEVRSGDEPYQLAILGACAVWGVTGLVTLSRATTSTTSTIPLWGAYVFFAFLSATCLVSLAGVAYEVLRRQLFGFYLERAGLIALVGLCVCYSIWAVVASGVRAASLVYLLGAVWIASSVRIRRISSGLREVAKGGDR